MLKTMDNIAYSGLAYALKKGLKENRSFEWFRATRAQLGIGKDTLIPAEYSLLVLAYRLQEYAPTDFGRHGKADEVKTRVNEATNNGKALYYREYCAHTPSEVDYKLGRKHVENKTSCGDWLKSSKNCSLASALRAYKKRSSLIRWHIEAQKIDILCTWPELFEYLSHYKRTENGEELGTAYWFKPTAKQYGGYSTGGLWIFEMKSLSGKKFEYLRACPFNRMGK